MLRVIEWAAAKREAWEAVKCEASADETHHVVTMHDTSLDAYAKGANAYSFGQCQHCGKLSPHQL